MVVLQFRQFLLLPFQILIEEVIDCEIRSDSQHCYDSHDKSCDFSLFHSISPLK